MSEALFQTINAFFLFLLIIAIYRKEKAPKAKPEREKVKRVREQKEVEEDDDEGEWHKISHKDDPTKPLFDAKVEITAPLVVAKLEEVIAQRGKKGTNRKIFVRHLQELYSIAVDNKLGAGVEAKVRSSLVSSLFEMSGKVNDAMDFEAWNK